MCSMDSYIEQTNMKLQTNIVSDIKREIDSLSSKVGTLNSRLANFLVKSEGEILRELDELESNIGEELDKLHGQKCSCECSGIDTPTEAPTKPPTEAPPTEAPTKPPTEAPAEEQSPCEGTGWRRVAYLNMADPDASCPKGWKLNTFDSQRVCGRASSDKDSCDSTTFSVGGEEYSQVCGKIKAYQFENSLGFAAPPDTTFTIDQRYADGVSLTRGSPRQHIWTFAAGAYESINFCACDENGGTPSFVGNDYFCESGFVSTNPLWDGKDCSDPACCSWNNPPYFLNDLQARTTDNIEARICLSMFGQDSDIMVEAVELYVM